MLSKWFKRKSVPNNDGNEGSRELGKLQFVKIFDLELSNMEDTPVYPLTNQLSVGSEIGNIVISDPSVSPRHATFILQDEVVSVIDHGSVAGTMINGQKIEPGKYIILEEADVVNVGDLEIRLRVGTQSVEPQEIPEIPAEQVKANIEEKKSSIKESAKKVAKPPRAYDKDKNKNKKKVKVSHVEPSANALVRVFSVICDLLFSYALLVIMSPFDEFRAFLKDVPEVLSSLIPVDWNAIWKMLQADYGFITEMLSDIYSFLAGTFDYVPLLILFILLRVISTLILGVSFSEYFLGVRPTSNPIYARVGGALRAIIGFVTWPFVIFDLPAIVSRRTFKEVITFTNITIPSKFIAVLGFIFYIPLVLLLVLASPLLEGFEPPEAVFINDRIDSRVRVKPAPTDGAPVVQEQLIRVHSDTLALDLEYDAVELSVFPDFNFSGAKSKINFKNALSFYQKDLQTEVSFEIFKTFDFRQLLGYGLKGNVFLYDKYPELYNFAYESPDINGSFKKVLNSKAHASFANQFITFTKTAFSLNLDNALELAQTETPYLKGFVDYKSAFFALIEYKDYSDIGFIKLGDQIFMKISYDKQKPFDLIIPLMKGQGRIFKVTFSKKEGAKNSSSKFYKFNITKSKWVPEPSADSSMSAFKVFDMFSAQEVKTLVRDAEKAQALYGYFFETSGTVLTRNDSVEIAIWKEKVNSFIKLIETVPALEQEGIEDPKVKLQTNLNDLKDALENNNQGYFGIQSTSTI